MELFIRTELSEGDNIIPIINERIDMRWLENICMSTSDRLMNSIIKLDNNSESESFDNLVSSIVDLWEATDMVDNELNEINSLAITPDLVECFITMQKYMNE